MSENFTLFLYVLAIISSPDFSLESPKIYVGWFTVKKWHD